MDWSEKKLCLKCNGGENLLVCSENDCPIAIHEGCMRCPARFNDAGKYFCPYCVYKHAVAELRQAKEFALARKKDLLVFLDKGLMGGENHLEENNCAEANGHTELKVGGDVNIRRFDAVVDQSGNPDEEHKIPDTEEDKSQASAGSEGQELSPKMHKEQKIIDEEDDEIEEENIQEEEKEEEDIWEEEKDNTMEEEDDTSAASSGKGNSHRMQEDKICSGEEMVQEKESETSPASTGQCPALTPSGRPKRGPKKRKLIYSDSEVVPKQKKRVRKNDEKKQTSPALDSPRKSSRSSSSAGRTEKVLDEKVDASRRSKRPQQPLIKLADDILGHGKRKTLSWSNEEEEKLKEGVEMYSSKGYEKVPWKEILELGRKVFDRTRTPSDLKNKWKKMSRKENKSRT